MFTRFVAFRQRSFEKYEGVRPCLHVDEEGKVRLASCRKVVDVERFVLHNLTVLAIIAFCMYSEA